MTCQGVRSISDCVKEAGTKSDMEICIEKSQYEYVQIILL